MKKIRKYLIVLLTISLLWIMPTVKADSDWGTDYDSGSDWGSSDWGSSDWGSSDYGYYDSNYDTSGGSSGRPLTKEEKTMMIVFILSGAIVFIIIDKIKAKKKSKINKGYVTSNNLGFVGGMTQDKINKTDSTIDEKELVNKTFSIYKDIQIAWMNFDYDTLQKLQTDEVFNNQKMKLETLNMKNEQNVMEDITLKDGYIEKTYASENKEFITVILIVTLRDYVINMTTKEVVRGHKDMIENTYRITCERTLGKQVTNCPNCGAKLDSNNSTKCSYCDSVVIFDSKEFKLSKKENINQRRV